MAARLDNCLDGRCDRRRGNERVMLRTLKAERSKINLLDSF